MFDVNQFRQEIIVPALSMIKRYSKDAEEIMVFTCAAESNGGTFLKQVKGPACGIFQMEPTTHQDIWWNFIRARRELSYPIGYNLGVNEIPVPERMIYDLMYATVMARIHYLRVPDALPDKDDIEGIYEYYKKHYNTHLGKATKAKSIKKYKEFIGL